MSRGFIQFNRSLETRELFKEPYAFTLLSVIAYRAKRTGDFNIHDLEIGEALIGDCKNYGMSEQRYRTSKKKLEKWGLATFRATNKGTIGNLNDSRIYDINAEEGNGQHNKPTTDKQRTDNGQITTINNENNENNETTTNSRDVDVISSIPDEITKRFSNNDILLNYAEDCGNDVKKMAAYIEYAEGRKKTDNPVGLAITLAKQGFDIPQSQEEKIVEVMQRKQERERERIRKDYSGWILEQPIDVLVKHLRNPEFGWLIKELRPEVVEHE